MERSRREEEVYHELELGWGKCIGCDRERREVRAREGWIEGRCLECVVGEKIYKCEECGRPGLGGERCEECDENETEERRFCVKCWIEHRRRKHGEGREKEEGVGGIGREEKLKPKDIVENFVNMKKWEVREERWAHVRRQKERNMIEEEVQVNRSWEEEEEEEVSDDITSKEWEWPEHDGPEEGEGVTCVESSLKWMGRGAGRREKEGEGIKEEERKRGRLCRMGRLTLIVRPRIRREKRSEEYVKLIRKFQKRGWGIGREIEGERKKLIEVVMQMNGQMDRWDNSVLKINTGNRYEGAKPVATPQVGRWEKEVRQREDKIRNLEEWMEKARRISEGLREKWKEVREEEKRGGQRKEWGGRAGMEKEEGEIGRERWEENRERWWEGGEGEEGEKEGTMYCYGENQKKGLFGERGGRRSKLSRMGYVALALYPPIGLRQSSGRYQRWWESFKNRENKVKREWERKGEKYKDMIEVAREQVKQWETSKVRDHRGWSVATPQIGKQMEDMRKELKEMDEQMKRKAEWYERIPEIRIVLEEGWQEARERELRRGRKRKRREDREESERGKKGIEGKEWDGRAGMGPGENREERGREGK